MSRLPVLTSRQVIKTLNNLGFFEARQKGSHKQFKHADGRFTTVPVHRGRDISPILLRKIISDIEITEQEFLAAR